MNSMASGLVDIVRDFLVVYQLTGHLADGYRSGELRFEEVQRLVGDSEDSALFRLKERCHSLFRAVDREDVALWREGLFDLAVGSLFHEAMKFRENFYQHVAYAPKVRALREGAGEDAAELFAEFEKIIAATSLRLDEGLEETEALLAQTRRQFRLLLVAHRENGLVTRYLVENASLVEEVFEEGLDALLAEIHGSAAEGYVQAAHSYLASGYFKEALRALDEARSRAGDREDLAGLSAYADGMAAYLDGRYGDAIGRLRDWVEGSPGADSRPFLELAHTAVSRIGTLLEGPKAREVAAEAARLTERLGALRPDGSTATPRTPPRSGPARSTGAR